MRIKNYCGYGVINAKKISRTRSNGEVSLHIRVSGNHECGIHRDDEYDVANWLVKRFDKQFTDYRSIRSMRLEDSFEKDANGSYVDVCDYYITYAA